MTFNPANPDFDPVEAFKDLSVKYANHHTLILYDVEEWLLGYDPRTDYKISDAMDRIFESLEADNGGTALALLDLWVKIGLLQYHHTNDPRPGAHPTFWTRT